MRGDDGGELGEGRHEEGEGMTIWDVIFILVFGFIGGYFVSRISDFKGR